MRISREVKLKARKIFEEKKIRKDFETEKRIHFKVQGETQEHFVIFDKTTRKFSCDCPYFSLKERSCSHIEAVKLFLSKKSG